MKKTTFFAIAGVVFVLIAVYFTFQLTAEAEIFCWAQFEFECDVYAQFLCLGSPYIHVRVRSWCEEMECWGEFKIYCEQDGDLYVFKGLIRCTSSAPVQCMDV